MRRNADLRKDMLQCQERNSFFHFVNSFLLSLKSHPFSPLENGEFSEGRNYCSLKTKQTGLSLISEFSFQVAQKAEEKLKERKVDVSGLDTP